MRVSSNSTSEGVGSVQAAHAESSVKVRVPWMRYCENEGTLDGVLCRAKDKLKSHNGRY